MTPEQKRQRVEALIRGREHRKQRDLERWCVKPSHGIVSAFLDTELVDGACAPCSRMRGVWASKSVVAED